MFYSPSRVNSPRLALIFLLFFTTLFARAQWTTPPDAAGNIHNTNPGAVNISRTGSGFALDVTGWSHVNGMFVSDAPAAGNISTWVRGYASANLVLQGGVYPGSAWEAYWITATNGILKIGANGGAEPAVGALNINDNGDIGIGTATPKAKLAVNGDILTKKVTVSLDNLPDYVFDKQYPLPSLPALEKYIRENSHLPGIPSADSVQRNGLDLGSNQAVLLQKIEELTLYVIQQNKTIEEMKKRLDAVEGDKRH